MLVPSEVGVLDGDADTEGAGVGFKGTLELIIVIKIKISISRRDVLSIRNFLNKMVFQIGSQVVANRSSKGYSRITC